MNRYRVIGPRQVHDTAPGEEFEAEFSDDEERDLLAQRRIEIVPRPYRVIGPRAVLGHKPGDVFEAALTAWHERSLVDHIERHALRKPPHKTKD